MWVILRLLTALVVGLLKFFRRRTSVQHTRRSGSREWVFRQGRNKKEITSTSFGVPLANEFFLRLSQEGRLDRFFKAVGFAREFQANDPSFDQQVYVACDHPAMEPVLQENHPARAAILSLFAGHAQRIYADGIHLWVQRDGDTLPSERELDALVTLRDALAGIPEEGVRVLKDSFFWRALLVESVAWSLAFYGVPALIEMAARPEPLYFAWAPVIRLGLIGASGIFIGLALLAWLLLRGSSRAHRVFVESILVLAVGVPLSSIEMVSDLNIALDHSAPAVIQTTVNSKYTTVTYGRRGRRRTHYYFRLEPQRATSLAIPASLKVSASLYASVDENSRIAVTLRQGALHLPWVEGITPAR